jgi:hypothetical protein
MNVVCVRLEGKTHLVVFLRSKHRPAVFFQEGDGQIIVSPASVDMAGHIVTPREQDFHRLDGETVAGIYREVSAPEELLVEILDH